MINNDTAKSTYTVTEGVTEYPIGFQYTTNPNGTPNLYVWYGDDTELEYGTGYTLSDDGLSIVLLSPVEADETLNVAVDEPFIQDSDYVIGRIDPEQIERDFDKSVLRDLELRDYADDINGRLADEVQARTDADTALQDAIDDEAEAREGADGVLQDAIDGKVSKTGDEMSGTLTWGAGQGGIEGHANGIVIGRVPVNQHNLIPTYLFDYSAFVPRETTVQPKNLGSLSSKWNKTYTKTINNGEDIAVPESGGTMARIEDLPTQASDVHALPDTTKYGASLVLSINPSTFVVTAQLKDQDNNNIGAAQTIDLPLESVVVSGAYDSATREVVLTLESGSTVRFSVADLVSGLQTEITSVNMLSADLVDDTTSTNKFVTATEKASWNDKVSKSGDTMSDALKFSNAPGAGGITGYSNGVVLFAGSTDSSSDARQPIMAVTEEVVMPYLNDGTALGGASHRWDSATIKSVYTTKINNGADIAVPTSGGTMARVEDLSGYLPTSGGTMTGTITLGSGANIVGNNRLINIGSSQYPIRRVYVDTLSGGDQYGRFMIPVADQSTFGFFIALVDPMPTARQDLEAMIFQYMGATDSNYTHGYFYECVTDDNTTWYWKRLDVQPSSGGGLPDQTGNAGKFLVTDGTDASWSDVTKTKNCYNEGAFQIGGNNSASLFITKNTTSTTSYTGGNFAGDNSYGGLDLRAGSGDAYTHRSYIFNKTSFSTNPIQGTHLCDLGRSDSAWKTVYAQKLNNGADIAVPTTGGTMAVIGVNSTVTLAVADWSSSTQTVTVSGVKADSVVFVSPAPASASDYASAGILCTAQAADSLTFSCTQTPSSAIVVNIVCM